MVIDWDTWEKTYKPIKNPNNPDPGFWGHMFETFGTDMEYMKSLDIPGKYYWTLVDNDPNSVYLEIVSGTYLFNRLGYFITEYPWEEEVLVTNDKSVS